MINILRTGAFAVALAVSPALVTVASAQEKAVKADPLPPELRSAFEGVVRDYILKNPALIREAMQLLQAREEAEKQAAATAALKQYRGELLQNANSPVGGNPEGDITVVEFFDYNCGYCKRVAPTMAAVVKNDPNVRVVYKEFAILGPQSIVAARAALAAKRQGKYHEFHVALMSADQADENSVAATARSLGLDYAKLVKDMEDPAISEQLERNYRLATAIGINGTPAFVIGDRLVPGAVDEAAMMEIIADERAKMKAAPAGN
ncbi:MAG: protein-disulfide isomerase [Paracoccaceae bacterium]